METERPWSTKAVKSEKAACLPSESLPWDTARATRARGLPSGWETCRLGLPTASAQCVQLPISCLRLGHTSFSTGSGECRLRLLLLSTGLDTALKLVDGREKRSFESIVQQSGKPCVSQIK